MLFLQLLIGLVFYFVVDAGQYLKPKTFSFQKWKNENLMTFVWGASIILLMFLVTIVGGEDVLNRVTSLVGISIEDVENHQDNAIILGVMIGFFIKKASKLTPKSSKEAV